MVDVAVRVSDDVLKKYEGVSNATVLGALAKRGYLKVFMNGVHSLAPGRRLVGRAVTLRYLPSRPDLQEHVTDLADLIQSNISTFMHIFETAISMGGFDTDKDGFGNAAEQAKTIHRGLTIFDSTAQ